MDLLYCYDRIGQRNRRSSMPEHGEDAIPNGSKFQADYPGRAPKML